MNHTDSVSMILESIRNLSGSEYSKVLIEILGSEKTFQTVLNDEDALASSQVFCVNMMTRQSLFVDRSITLSQSVCDAIRLAMYQQKDRIEMARRFLMPVDYERFLDDVTLTDEMQKHIHWLHFIAESSKLATKDALVNGLNMCFATVKGCLESEDDAVSSTGLDVLRHLISSTVSFAGNVKVLTSVQRRVISKKMKEIEGVQQELISLDKQSSSVKEERQRCRRRVDAAIHDVIAYEQIVRTQLRKMDSVVKKVSECVKERENEFTAAKSKLHAANEALYYATVATHALTEQLSEQLGVFCQLSALSRVIPLGGNPDCEDNLMVRVEPPPNLLPSKEAAFVI